MMEIFGFRATGVSGWPALRIIDRQKFPSHLCLLLLPVAAFAQSDQAAFQKVCGACHSYTLISDFKSSEEWSETVQYMVDHGAKGTPEQMAGVARHLTRNFTRTNVNTAPAAELAAVLSIDEALAQKIVERRNFTTLDELKKIVPPAKVDARKDRIAFH